MAAPAEASPLRRLVAHSGIYTLSRIASQGAAFFMLPLYTHALGTEGLGVVEITNAARGLLMIVLLQGLHSAWFRLRYNLLEDEAALHRFETSLVWYLLVSNVAIIAVVSVLGANTWNRLAPGVPYYPFGLLTFLASGCTVFGNLVERKLQAQQRAWQFAVFTLLRTIGTLGCIVVFVALLKRGPLGKLEGEVLAGAVGAISAWWILKPGSPRLVSRDDVKRSLAYGWPLVPHGLAGVINDMIDRFMVNSMMGLAAAGVYSL
ncbi:MAG TPA: oligosaccharide flippase family protein, partial [Polyangiales bacterium]|nr:oligosaccharide flippase family protein [Polyangiales bacterium]